MGGKEQGNAGGTIVKIGPKANELKHFRIAKPVESDPGRAAAAANRLPRNFGRDFVGLSLEGRLVGRPEESSIDACIALTLGRCLRLLIEIFPDHLNLPADLILIERLQPRAGALEP